MRLLAPSLCLLVLFSACAKEQTPAGPGSAETSAVYTTPTASLSESQTKAKNATISCKPGAHCDPSVGMLSFANENSAGLCTVSLISEDTLATNTHCIPDDLKKAGSSCENRIWFHFVGDAAKPSYETMLECGTVIFASVQEGTRTTPEYAYLKVKKSSRRPFLNVSRQGFADLASYTVNKVDPDPSKPALHGDQDSVNCLAIQNSMVTPGFFFDRATVVNLAGCKLNHGNSGSAVTAADGSLRGMLFAILDPAEINGIFAQNPDMKRQEKTANLNTAANFACLGDPSDPRGERLPSFCVTAIPSGSDHALADAKLARKKITDQVRLAMHGSASGTEDFEWTIEAQNKGRVTTWVSAGYTVRAVPSCVKAAAVSRYVNNQVTMRRQSFTVTEYYDRYIRLETRAENPQSYSTQIHLTEKSGKFSAELQDGASTSTYLIPLCS